MNSRKQYEEDLKERQIKHLQQLFPQHNWKPCLHDSCPNCLGTGIAKTGGFCIHNISCSCPKCTPSYCVPNYQIPINNYPTFGPEFWTEYNITPIKYPHC